MAPVWENSSQSDFQHAQAKESLRSVTQKTEKIHEKDVQAGKSQEKIQEIRSLGCTAEDEGG